MTLRFLSAPTACLLAGTLALAVFQSNDAQAVSFDFESLAHGEVVSNQLDGVSITAVNPNRTFDIAAVFDTHARGTRDSDLEADLSGGAFWSAGNLANEDLGSILIIQENSLGCSTGVCTAPDDEGGRPAGILNIALSMPVLDFGFDLIDVENLTVENATIELFNGNQSVTVGIMEFLDLNSARYDPTIVLGNNSANRFAAITAESVGLDQIDGVAFNLGGSGAIDNLNGTVVPEPSAALLIGLGLSGLASRRRRRALLSR